MSDHELGLTLSAYLDGELPQGQRLRVGRHLAACAECRAELEALAQARGRLRGARELTVPAAALARSEAWLAGLPAGAPPRAPAFAPARRWLMPAGMAFAGALAAAWLSAAHRGAASPQPIPLDALLAAHYRYSTDSTSAQGHLVASNYSDGWAFDEAEHGR